MSIEVGALESSKTWHCRAMRWVRAGALSVLSFWCTHAQAEDSPQPVGRDLGQHAIDEQHPEDSVPTPEQALRNPLEMGYFLMDLIARADAATARGDHSAAVRYYRAMAKAVPERATAFSKLCQSYEALGDLTSARESCQKALGRSGVTTQDYARWVRLTLRQPGAPSASDVTEIDSVIGHLDTELAALPEGKLLAAELGCELAAKLEDEARLTRCTKQLAAVAPDDPRTFTYRWALALQKGELDVAEQTLVAARAKGFPEAALLGMHEKIAQARQKPTWLSAARAWAGPFVLIVASLGYWLWSLRRRHAFSSAS